MREAVPAVEVADDVDGLGARRPDGEGDSPDVAERAGVVAHVGAEDGPQLLVAALVDQVPVDLAERGGEPVGVVLLVLDAVAVRRRAGGSRASCRSRARSSTRCRRGRAEVDHARPSRAARRRDVANGRYAVMVSPPGPEVVAQQVVRLAVAAVEEGA